MNIAVFCGSHLGRNPHLAEAATSMGRLLAQQGHNLIYGGSSWGYMGLVAQGALSAGGHVTAVIPSLFSQEVIHSQEVSQMIVVKSMSERKHQLALLSDAFIALSGGAGTLDEITEMLTNNQLRLQGGMSEVNDTFSAKDHQSMSAFHLKPVGILNTDGFYDPFLQQLHIMCQEGLLAENHYQAVLSDSTPQGLLEKIENYCR